jgi:hypothetical protein
VAVVVALVLVASAVWYFSTGGGDKINESSSTNGSSSITLLYHKGGETLAGTETIKWTASGNDSLSITIQYTTDAAPYCPTYPPQTWHDIAVNEPNDGTFEWDTTQLSDGYTYSIKVIASDGENTSIATSGYFTIKNEG